uniref:superinfection immunity protein n=1 Tax=Ningiella ruwaisensis TaxID=2364274 RepID=UPI00109F41D1|nr:superinfection immunity protein [Ningiella ruwaisensis]
MELINNYFTALQTLNSLQIMLIVAAVLIVWFLPAMIAAVLNPAHAKYIVVACVPAGFSLIAWSGLMIWACTGKVFEKYKDKVAKDQQASI